jgi:hypothetical protein
MDLIQSKSLLAKLMATENIIVEQRNVRTASFDVSNRILTVPTLDSKISPFLYDLFMGHETGHAIYTPEDGMKKAISMKLSMSVANVVEDARIERKIKDKYPGLRNSFIRGYRELIEKDFFGTNGVDLNTMNFIDRCNLYFKGGATFSIKFNDKENQLVDLINGTKSYDDVIEVTKKVMEYLKEEKEERKKTLSLPEESDDDLESDEDDERTSDYLDDYLDDLDDLYEDEKPIKSSSNKSDEKGEESPKKVDAPSEKNMSGSEADKEEDAYDAFRGAGFDSFPEEDIRSHTDDAFRQNESKLFSASSMNYYYGNIPNIESKDVIVPYKTIWNRYRQHNFEITDLYKKYGDPREVTGIDTAKFQKVRTEAAKVSSYLAKEFELRKNADQMKRASISKTGELNMSRISNYQFSEDIFKKITVVPGGKSHGLVMFIDWSGSMTDHIQSTIKQLINLVMFCKKVSIPYEVYAFTTSYYPEGLGQHYRASDKQGDIVTHSFSLLNILSSKMSAVDFTYAGSALIEMFEPQYRRNFPDWFSLGGTPLNETVIAAMNIVPEFQKSYKLQIVNTVFLTDGEGHSNASVYGESSENSKCVVQDPSYKDRLILRDPITKNQEIPGGNRGRQLTASYIKLLKSRTNCNIVGFYILNGRNFRSDARDFFPSTANFDQLYSTFSKEKSLVVTSAGYDEYYMLRANAMNTEEGTEFTVKENATTKGLVSAFSKYTGNRLSNRVVLNRFIGMIA